MISWGLQGQCIAPGTAKCYNVVPKNSSDSEKEKTRPCCFDDFSNRTDKCVVVATSYSDIKPEHLLCHVDPVTYQVAAIKKAFHDYGYDATIRELSQKFSKGTISEAEAFEKVNERIAEIPNPVEIIGKDDFTKEVLSLNIPVLVDFWAPWCKHCQNLSPVINELVSEYNGKLKICKVNMDINKNKELFEDYNVDGFPTLLLFKDGYYNEVEISGNKDELKKNIETALS